MAQGTLNLLDRQEKRLEALGKKRVLSDPMAFLQDRRLQLDYVQQKLASTAREQLADDTKKFAQLTAKLDALSPLKVLGRGYAMAQRTDGTVLRSSEQVEPGDLIRVRLADGSIGCTVEDRE